MKETVTISRKWNNPEIKMAVNGIQIHMEMSLDDFVTALLTELEHPTTIWTRGQMDAKVRAAVIRVVEGVKEESVKIVS